MYHKVKNPQKMVLFIQCISHTVHIKFCMYNGQISSSTAMAHGLPANINTKMLELPIPLSRISRTFMSKSKHFGKNTTAWENQTENWKWFSLHLPIAKFCQFLRNVWCRPLLKDRVIATPWFGPSSTDHLKTIF